MVLPALISAGASVAGKLIGNKPQQQVNTVDYQAMVRNAEAAGFNPLTALRNGGAAGFTTTTMPKLSTGQIIGEGISQFGNAVGDYLQNFDPHADATREQGARLMQAQIENLYASTRNLGSQIERRASGAAGALSGVSARVVPSGAPMTPRLEEPTLTNPYGVGTGLHVDAGTPDAAAAEERYGDVLSNVFGVYNLYQDTYLNFKRHADAYFKGGKKAGGNPAPSMAERARRSATKWWR